MNTPQKILYVGSLEKESNSRKRFLTLQRMGYQVEGIDVDPYIFVPFWLRFHYHLYVGPGIRSLNKDVLQKVHEFQPDILWVDNKPYLKSATLKKIKQSRPEMKLANIITDDPCGHYAYCWKRIYGTFKQYDIQFVQREVNVNELLQLGSKRVEICYRSFDPAFHRPLPAIQSQRNDSTPVVGFIGSYESDREEYIAYLVQNGINVEITGNDWPKGKHWQLLKKHYKGPSVYGEAYIETINKMDIALHFLRKANRDQQDSRTFEIPACGVFMLAERSHLHQELFKENKECDYFTTKEEMLSKVRYYLQQPQKREHLAAAALQRSFYSGYDHASRLKYVLERIVGVPMPPKKYDRIVAGIYYDPDFYPPTINAVLNLSRICNELIIVTRNNNTTDFPYPSNVKLLKSGPFMTVLDSEKKSTLFKVFSFLQFTFHLWKQSRSKKTGLVVYYDAIPLLSFFLTRFISSHHPVRWYHNHDMPGTHPLRKYSIGWLAQVKEYAAMDQMDYFTLPSQDRLVFYPNWNRPQHYFTLPNYPSANVYTAPENKFDTSDDWRIIYQGTIGEQLALESMMVLLQQQPFSKPVRLVLKGGIREEYKNKLMALARQSGVENYIEWHGLGPYRELPAVTATCHIGLAVYMGTDNVRKTLGTASNKIYEYAACGLPVILYDNEQFRKYLSAYPWAFFSNGTPESLRTCIESIADAYADLSTKARHSFEKELNFETAFSTFMNQLTK